MNNKNSGINNIQEPVSDKFNNADGKSHFNASLRGKTTDEMVTHISDCNNFELLNYNNPEFIREGKERYSFALPETCFLLFTHGTFALPEEVRHDCKQGVLKILSDAEGIENQVELTKREIYNLLRNFSDYMTRFEAKRALKNGRVSEEQVITHALSRALGDPNRPKLKNIIIINRDTGDKKYIQPEDRDNYIMESNERDWSEEFIRKSDFGGIKLIGNPKKFEDKGENALNDYSAKIATRLQATESNNGYSFTTDGHDTHDLIYTLDQANPELRPGGNPYVSLGTLDGESCHPDIVKLFKNRFAYHLGIDENKILVNDPYTGGYTTLEHGMGYRQKLKKEGKNPNIRNIIQIEMGRFLYSKPDGRVDHDRAEFIGECKIRAMTDVDRAIKLGKIDLLCSL